MERTEEMHRKLHEAATEGDVASLQRLVEEDALVLHRCAAWCFAETPLHIAAMLGHLEFTTEILSRKPEFAKEPYLGKPSPLHLATANGHLEVVKKLLLVNPDMCLAKDRDRRNPLHIAVIRGRVDVLKELVQAKPEAVKLQGERGETILHLCVKHNQLEALNFLVETVNDNGFINSIDDDGLTVLHLAVADREIEIINFLITKTAIKVNALNASGFTALDIVIAQGRRNVKDIDIQDSLRRARAVCARDISSPMHEPEAVRDDNSTSTGKDIMDASPWMTNNWLEKKKNALMVVAILIATMAFQAGINPPGGVWQEVGSAAVGTSIMATTNTNAFYFFIVFNSLSFLAALGVILLLISGLPLRRRFFMWILMVIMWMAILSTTLAYAFAISNYSSDVTIIVIFSVFGLVALLIVAHSLRLTIRFVKFTGRLIRNSEYSPSVGTSRANV